MLEGVTPWPEDFVLDYRQKGYWQETSISEMFDQIADAFPNREALVSGNLRLTYQELRKKADCLAASFISIGLRPLDRLILQLPNAPEFVYIYLALAKIGVIPVMCLAAHRQSEIEYIAQHTGAKGYVIPENTLKFDYLALAHEVQRKVPGVKYIFTIGLEDGDGCLSINKLLEKDTVFSQEQTALYKPNPFNAAVFQLSGGTTGMPKIIPRLHTDYVYNSRMCGLIAGFNHYTVFLATTPLAHNFALACPGIQAVLMVGGKIVIPTAHQPKDVFAAIQQERVTYVPAVPAMLINWINSPEISNYDLSSWQVVISGGAKLNPEVASRVKPVLGCKLQQIFGMAEGLLVMTSLDDPEEAVLETIGKPISPGDEVKIVDDEGNEVEPGQVGEMICRGPYTLRGYYKASEHNEKAFTGDGFFRTGDLVRKRLDGFLTVEGRKKDLINRGGEKISVEEIENLILAHPAVANVAVVAMPDQILGERACAYVSLKAGNSLELEQLNNYLLEQKIAKFKLPERLEVLDVFPLTNVGKISKKDLRNDIHRKLSEEEK
ncbi:MAG: AMP-binding protein [Clostridia bacterium]|jgi:2,3-dihydroxybenzoate-AMP ligase|nr:AMP-binding protein [Clostridia bacterium]